MCSIKNRSLWHRSTSSYSCVCEFLYASSGESFLYHSNCRGWEFPALWLKPSLCRWESEGRGCQGPELTHTQLELRLLCQVIWCLWGPGITCTLQGNMGTPSWHLPLPGRTFPKVLNGAGWQAPCSAVRDDSQGMLQLFNHSVSQKVRFKVFK